MQQERLVIVKSGIWILSNNRNSIPFAFCLMCTGSEKRLQDRLQTLAGNQQVGKQDMQEIAETADNLSRQKQTYKTNVDDIQSLTEDIKLQLEQARAALRIAVRHLTRAQETDVDQL